MAEALEAVQNFISSRFPHQVITANAEMVYSAWREPALREVINRAALVTPDGVGVVWAARFLGFPLRERVAGVDLVTRLAAVGAREGWRFFFYGAAPGIAEAAAARLCTLYPGLQVVGTAHGYLSELEEKELLQKITSLRPEVLLVALGAPKQEFWIACHLSLLGVPVCLGVGGSFDVLAGRVKRAPAWMQKTGLEWLYRVGQEPRRLKRIRILPLFVGKVIFTKRKRPSKI